MMKIYKKLSEEQMKRGVVFSSTLSINRTEMEGDTVHEVLKIDEDKDIKMKRLLDDKFFNKSHFKFNIIRNPDYSKLKKVV